MSSIKYKVNHNPVTYDHRTKKYRVGKDAFGSYKDARAKRWKCEKCRHAFSSFKELRTHKNDRHAY